MFFRDRDRVELFFGIIALIVPAIFAGGFIGAFASQFVYIVIFGLVAAAAMIVSLFVDIDYALWFKLEDLQYIITIIGIVIGTVGGLLWWFKEVLKSVSDYHARRRKDE